MKRRLHIGSLLALVALAACGQDPIVVPVRNLDRPADMGFTCVSVAGDRLSGRPMSTCHPDGVDPIVVANQPRSLGNFGLVTNTARGELSVVDLDLGQLVDLDPGQPGFNTLPLGPLAEAIAVSQDGCRSISANRGACHLSLVDNSRLLHGVFPEKIPSSGEGPVVEQVVLTTPSGRRLSVAPHEVLFLPQPLEALQGDEHLCAAGDGAFAMDARVPWRALVTLPGCDLVAMIELPSGRIVSAVHVRAGGLVDTAGEPQCPTECGPGDGSVMDMDMDMGAPDGGSSAGGASGGGASPLQVGAMALMPDGSRVYVAAAHAPFISALDITPAGLQVPADGGRIPLHEGAGGVQRLRLAVDPYSDSLVGDGATIGPQFVGAGRGQFMYAFARDGSLRVVDVGRGELLGGRERECDVNVDLAAAGFTPQDAARACFPISEDPQAPSLPRRPLAQGPGLRIPTTGGVSPPIPRDISFASLQASAGRGENSDQVLNGDFGFLLASDGNVYVLNIAPAQAAGGLPTRTHSFRNALRRNLAETATEVASGATSPGGPQLLGTPTRITGSTVVPLPTRLALTPLRGPRLAAAPSPDPQVSTLSYVRFPDGSEVLPQGWLVIWEDVLPETRRATGVVRPPAEGMAAGAVEDLGGDFCRRGVLPRDVLLFSSCNDNADCRTLTDDTAVCRQATLGAPGLCLRGAAATDEQLFARCERHLASRRRYEVVNAGPTRLELGLKLDEIPRPALAACTTDEECQPSPLLTGFRCLAVRADEPKRCVRPCSAARMDDRSCRPGTVCEDVPGSLVGPLCVEGPPLDPACWPKDALYMVQAGQSFLVSGSASAIPTTAREEGGRCVPDTTRNPLLVNRIPLDAPVCATVPEGADTSFALGQMPSAMAGWGNPCLYRAPNQDDPSGDPSPKVKALFQNHQVRFVLTNLDEYAGDGLLIRFEIGGGFAPEVARFPADDLVISIGTRILTGPMSTPESPGLIEKGKALFPYLYVIDQGRTFSTPGARGQVLRLNPRRTPGLPRFDSNFTSHRFHIQ